MSIVNVSEVSRITGKSRNTIKSHLKSGKLSGHKNDEGIWEIDTSELVRAYPALKTPIDQGAHNDDQGGQSGLPSKTRDMISELATIKERLRLEESRRSDVKNELVEQIDFLKEQIAVKDKQIGSFTAQIEDHRERRAKTEDRAFAEKDELGAERDKYRKIALGQKRQLRNQERAHREELEAATTIGALFAKWLRADSKNDERQDAIQRHQV